MIYGGTAVFQYKKMVVAVVCYSGIGISLALLPWLDLSRFDSAWILNIGILPVLPVGLLLAMRGKALRELPIRWMRQRIFRLLGGGLAGFH